MHSPSTFIPPFRFQRLTFDETFRVSVEDDLSDLKRCGTGSHVQVDEGDGCEGNVAGQGANGNMGSQCLFTCCFFTFVHCDLKICSSNMLQTVLILALCCLSASFFGH